MALNAVVEYTRDEKRPQSLYWQPGTKKYEESNKCDAYLSTFIVNAAQRITPAIQNGNIEKASKCGGFYRIVPKAPMASSLSAS